MKKINLLLAFVLLSSYSFAQLRLAPGYYAIFFKDKLGCEFTVDSAQKFLSQKAIERRNRLNITIDSTDLPVSKKYTDSISKLGFEIWLKSKWLNAVVIKCTDSTKLDTLKKLSFVLTDSLPVYNGPNKIPNKAYKIKFDSGVLLDLDTIEDKFNYASASEQIMVLRGNYLHRLGYTGKGVTISIFDAGFFQVNRLEPFKHMIEQGRLIDYYDFVDNDTNLFDQGTHGLAALSTMAANYKRFVGTAPDASYMLFRTENGDSEYKLEEFNWVCAAEYADSAGTDVISSSLGYSTFDDSTMNYQYEQMDGRHALSSIAASYAAEKGILVVISAGNEGDTEWQHITSPADAINSMAIGAVNYRGKTVFFSSYGPTSDGRIKPDAEAIGLFTAVISSKGNVTYMSGTSFSGPTFAGLVACLRQAHPDKPVEQIIEAIHMAGDKASAPTEQDGYGVTDFMLTNYILENYDFEKQKSTSSHLKIKSYKVTMKHK